ncbi:MAG TPA: glycosyltransferase family 4 protein [Baekduia sp.]|nr:glycosyltransferase family 4 protein [Baekduia sp.]
MRVLSGLQFFPRGGSAHVARSLARELPAHGWDVTVVSGSLPPHGDAAAFYRGLDIHPVRFGADAPMHPSYEDRPGAPDPVFASVDQGTFERHVGAWARALHTAGAARHDVLHLHHLTPLNEAAELVAPDVPIVGHLHGTELLMLEQIDAGPPASWAHAAAWAERLRRWAQACERLLVLTPGHAERASRLLGIDTARCVVSPNGIDPARFDRRPVDREAHWSAVLGKGRRAAGRVARSVVLLYVGRFTEVKRVPLLIEAFTHASARFRVPASLVLVGGHPGEHEGEHPADTVKRLRARHVHLAGWQDHDALPGFLNAADALVLPSVREQFGAVLVEAMACGLPVVAVDRFGPGEIIDDGRTGWLVEPDDLTSLADALVTVVNREDERRRRGAAAHTTAHERWTWPAIAGRVAGVLDEVAEPAGAGRVAPRSG